MAGQRTLHITLERCGSQWVRNLLTRREILQSAGFTYSNVTGSIATVEHLELGPRMLAGPIYNMNRWEWRCWRKPGDKAIVVLRDPRDIIVSLMFAWLYSHSSLDPNIMVVRRILSMLPAEDDRLSYVMGAIGQSHRMIWSWTVDHAADDATLIRYEDLVADSLAGFSQVLDRLGWKVPPHVLREAVEATSFESQGDGRKRGTQEVYSHHRRGQPGAWRDHFTLAHGQLWEAMYPGLLRASGYETSDQWWETLPETLTPVPKRMATDPANVVVETLQRRNAHLEREIERKEHVIRELVAACEERLAALQEKEQVIDQLSQACDARLAAIHEKEQMIQTLARQLDATREVTEASCDAVMAG